MTKFNANNFTNLRELFIDRILYEAYALSNPGSVEPAPTPTGIKDYWSRENLLYGKVDKSFDAIAVRKVALTSYSQGNNRFMALPGVIESFKQMKTLFMQRSRSGLIAKGPFLGNLEIHKAFSDPDMDYNIYLTQVIEDFNKHIVSIQQDTSIKNAGDYTRIFFDYYLAGNAVAFLTRSAYYLSNRVNALNSGLSIEITTLDPSDNSQKQAFIESPNFEFFREAAINFGFLIDKNIPWRLNYDLSSPINKKYMQFGLTVDPVSDFLSANFYKIYFDDLDYLISAAVLGYNTLTNFRPFYREGLCTFERKKIDKAYIVNELLGTPYWIKKYILVKNKENNYRYTTSELDKIIFNAIDLGTQHSPAYIQNKFNTPYTFEGSTTYQLLRREFIQNNDFPLDKFHEYVIMLIKKSTDRIY